MTTQLRFGSADETLLRASDEEFLAAVKWRGSRSSFCRELGKSPDSRAIGLCWKQQCPEVSADALGLPESSLRLASLDGWVQQAATGTLGELLGSVRGRKSRASKATVQQLEDWLSANTQRIESDSETLLALCELLIVHCDRLPAELLGRLWRSALAGAISQAERFEAVMHTEDWQARIADEKNGGQWLTGGLLPWTCGILFDEVKGATRLAKSARAALNFQLQHSTGSDGSPAGDLLRHLRVGLAGWADAVLVGELFGRELWRSSTHTRCARFLECVAATLRSDGGAATTAASSESDIASLSLTLGRLSGINFRKRWARLVEDVATGTSLGADSKSSSSVRKKDGPSWQSDDAQTACLRTSWARDASLFTIAHDEQPVSIEMVIEGTPILTGPWGIDLAEDGDAFEFEASWECVCFYTDKDVEYLELQFEFEGGPTIDRYLVMSRARQFAVVADILVDSPAQRTDLISLLPLADGVEVETVAGSREHRLKAGRQQARVLPLALPHDAGIGTPGRIGIDETGPRRSLAIGHASETGGLFSPVLIDWSKHRRNAPVEWRNLTITEAGEIDRSGAFAYRCRVGDLHLVLFRALKSTADYRTVLGYQPENETVLADFTAKGQFEEILLVE